MTTILTNLAFVTVAAGIILQVATLARIGGDIARNRLTEWCARRNSTTPARSAPPAQRVLRRRPCRDYRVALATGRG